MANEGPGEHEPSAGELAAMDEFIGRLQQGERPDVEEFLARFPGYAASLRPVLEAAVLLHRDIHHEDTKSTRVKDEVSRQNGER